MWSFACFGREKNTKETQTTVSYVRYLRHLLDPSGFAPDPPSNFSDGLGRTNTFNHKESGEKGKELAKEESSWFRPPKVVAHKAGRGRQSDGFVA